VAAAEFDVDHVAELVRACVVPSLKVPVAVNWSVVPFGIEVFGAVIAIDCSVAAVTVRVIVLDVTPLWVALMFVDPTPAPVASPAALTIAAAVFEDDQVAEVVRFCVVPSEKVPVAVN
jgi:hypothetical protein